MIIVSSLPGAPARSFDNIGRTVPFSAARVPPARGSESTNAVMTLILVPPTRLPRAPNLQRPGLRANDQIPGFGVTPKPNGTVRGEAWSSCHIRWGGVVFTSEVTET